MNPEATITVDAGKLLDAIDLRIGTIMTKRKKFQAKATAGFVTKWDNSLAFRNRVKSHCRDFDLTTSTDQDILDVLQKMADGIEVGCHIQPKRLRFMEDVRRACTIVLQFTHENSPTIDINQDAVSAIFRGVTEPDIVV